MLNVVGVFNNAQDAHAAVRDLMENGFRRDDISVISQADSESTWRREAAGEASGTATGAGVGAAIGGVGGLLAGLAALAIPGFGPLIAAGPIMAALGGAGVGAVTGGLIGALTDVGIPEAEAEDYAERVRRGGTLITVTTDTDESADRASEIINRHNVSDIEMHGSEERMEERPSEISTDMETAQIERERQYERSQSPSRTQERVMPVVEEQLNVGKKAVEGRGVRIYGRVTEKPVEETVRLREERVHVERRPVDRPVSGGEKFSEGVIEITETKEEPVVGKQERVVEEIVISKEIEERDEKVRDTVRRKDVEIEERGHKKDKQNPPI